MLGLSFLSLTYYTELLGGVTKEGPELFVSQLKMQTLGTQN